MGSFGYRWEILIMVYWQVTFNNGSLGYQIMDDDLGNAIVKDIDGNLMTGEFEYTTTDIACALPVWA